MLFSFCFPPLNQRPSHMSADTSAPEGFVDVLGSGALLRKILVPSDVAEDDNPTDTKPTFGQEAVVRHVVRLRETGTVLESSLTGEPFRFFVGDGDSVQALDVCVPLMDLHERSLFQVDPKFAFGTQGQENPHVPPNAWLELEIELLSFSDRPVAATAPLAERLTIAERKRERGNFYFRRGDYPHALNLYARGLEYVLGDEQKATALIKSKPATTSDGEDGSAEAAAAVEKKSQLSQTADEQEVQAHLDALRLKLVTNVATAQWRLGDAGKTKDAAEAALELDSKNVKALFLQARACRKLKEYEAAVEALQRAVTIEPTNAECVNELAAVRKLLEKQVTGEKELFSKMLGSPPAKSVIDAQLLQKEKNSRLASKQGSIKSFLSPTVVVGIVAMAIIAVAVAYLTTS